MLKIFRESIDIKKRLRDFEILRRRTLTGVKRGTAAVATTRLFLSLHTNARERARAHSLFSCYAYIVIDLRKVIVCNSVIISAQKKSSLFRDSFCLFSHFSSSASAGLQLLHKFFSCLAFSHSSWQVRNRNRLHFLLLSQLGENNSTILLRCNAPSPSPTD
jgi:hypothetical protein